VLRRVPKVVSTTVSVNTAAATKKVKTWFDTWNNIQIAVGFKAGPMPQAEPAGAAAGVPGTGPRHGGFISGPGSGTSDSIPAMLSNGEFVINAAQTAKYRGLLEDINTSRRGFADGGFVAARDPVRPVMCGPGTTRPCRSRSRRRRCRGGEPGQERGPRRRQGRTGPRHHAAEAPA
jgi:hypothetical protein